MFWLTFFIVAIFPMPSEQNGTVKRTLRASYSGYPTWWEPCGFEKPITCNYPGSSIETMWVLEKFYNAEVDYVYFKGFGVGAPTETDTVCKGIMNGTVDLGANLL